jgi:transposase
MFISEREELTILASVFINPTNPVHRQYEALRAYYVDRHSSAEAAKRFRYTSGSFRVLCHDFRKCPDKKFFIEPVKGPQKAPKRDQSREKVIELRKGNLSIYDIQRCLRETGIILSTVSITKILKEEGFARLPRRADDERPDEKRAEKDAVADVRELELSPQSFHTRYGGLFLFLPYLGRIRFDTIMEKAGLPGTKMVPSPHAIRSLLALKLFGNARYSHIMSYVFDKGLALFAGLNAIPKRSFLGEYSSRIDPRSYPRLMDSWFDEIGKIGLERGVSFNLDFHTIPFYGEDELIEKHYVPRRSHKQKGMLAFLAHDADKHVFCYANATVSKASQNDEILRFIDFWEKRTGKLPEELIFDSKLTTYTNLNHLNHKGVRFMTLRRRTDTVLDELYRMSSSAWRRIELHNIARAYRTPRIIDQKIELDDYEGTIRQIAIRDLGHEEPTLLLTNQLTRPAASLIDRYAKRMVIENAIADGIDFFHIDALSSSVAIKVDCDLQLTLMASSLYRLLGAQIGGQYVTAKSRRIFRDFIDATAHVTIAERDIFVQFQKRAHNPLLKAAGFADKPVRIPWLGNKRLHFQLG